MKQSLQQKFDKHVIKSDNGCWLWRGAINSGSYGQVTVDGVIEWAHRASWFLHHGTWPARDQFVCHTCDVRPCVNPDHLFLGDHRANMKDAVAKRRFPTGNQHWNAKLNAVDAERARDLHRAGLSQNAIARYLGSTQGAIQAIVTGRTWR